MEKSLIQTIADRVRNKVVDELQEATEPKVRKRDECFEILGDLEGDWQHLTKSARGAVNKALKEIREVHPGLTPNELRYRIARYRKLFPNGAIITANAVARHWARLA